MEIQLYPNQELSFHETNQICDNNYFWCNDGVTGSGKTITTCKVAADRGLALVIIGPVASLKIWEEETAKYNIPIYLDPQDKPLLMSYKKFSAAGSENQPEHQLLEKVFIIQDQKLIFSHYITTTYFNELLEAGVCFIFDEAHNLTGDSQQSLACYTIMKGLKEAFYKGSLSRAAFLSATMIDSTKQLINFLRNVAIIEHRNLFHTHNGLTTFLGFEQFYLFSMEMDNKNTVQYWTRHPPQKSILNDQIWEFYNLILKKKFTTTLLSSNVEVKQKIVNLYVEFATEKERKAYINSVTSLDKLLYDVKVKDYKVMKSTFGNIMRILPTIQYAKRNLLIDLCNNIMKATYYKGKEIVYPKVVIYVTFLEILDYCVNKLAAYNPLILKGGLTTTQRSMAIDKFNEENNDHRLLICTLQTGGVSISLHSKNENFPRIALALPDYQTKNQQQAAGRFYREGARGSALICFIFGDNRKEEKLPTENSLISTIYKKGKKLSEFHSEQGGLFPCDYPSQYVENEYIPTPPGLKSIKNDTQKFSI